MTVGERMVWAAAFERGIFDGRNPHQAAVNARTIVELMQRARNWPNMDAATRSMLDEMLGPDPEQSDALYRSLFGGPPVPL